MTQRATPSSLLPFLAVLLLAAIPVAARAQDSADPEAGDESSGAAEDALLEEDEVAEDAPVTAAPAKSKKAVLSDAEKEAMEEEEAANQASAGGNAATPGITAGPVGPGGVQLDTSGHPFRIMTSISSSVGQGSFVANQGARNAYWDWSLSLTPMYTLMDGAINISGSVAINQELTESDGDTVSRRVLLSDASLGASHMIWTIPGADIGVIVGARASFPTSIASQTQSLLLGLRGSLTLMRSFGPVMVMYSGGFRKNFHQYQSPVYDTEGMDDNIFIAREGGNERVDAFLYTGGGNNVSYSFSNSLSVNVQIIGGLSANASYQISNGFTYASYEKDSMASVNARAGRGQRDSFSTNLSVSYPIPYVFLTLGLSNSASPYSDDNSHLRFPFWDFENEADNLSTVYLNAMSNISIDGSGVNFQ
jgi:hypothetical protein